MIRFRLLRITGFFCIPFLAACSSESILSKVAPPEADKYARAFFETMRAGTPEDAKRQLSAGVLQNQASMDSVQSLRQQFAAFGVLDSAKLTNAQLNFGGGSTPTRRVLMYELWGHGAIALAEIEIQEDGTGRSVNGLQLQPIPKSLEATNGFMANAGPAQVAVLLVAIGLALFEIGTAIIVARTPMPRRWLWAVFALFGIGTFAMNWTTGGVSSNLFSFQLIGSIQRVGLAGPWVIAVSFPLGAIVALRKRSQALTTSAIPPAGTPAVETTVVRADEIQANDHP
jgi:hypothetical protein